MKKIAVIRNTELVRNCETLEKIETLSRKYGILTATLPDGVRRIAMERPAASVTFVMKPEAE